MFFALLVTVGHGTHMPRELPVLHAHERIVRLVGLDPLLGCVQRLVLRGEVSFSHWGGLGGGDDERDAGDDGGLHGLVLVVV